VGDRFSKDFTQERRSIMTPQPAKDMQTKLAVEVPVKSECGDLLDRMKGVYETVARRAYEFFERRGRAFGHDLDDWFRAELEMLRPVPVDVEVNETEIRVKAEIPGFRADDIEVSAEPRRLVIHGYQEKIEEEKKDNLALTERRAGDVFRAMELPAEIDPTKATAKLTNGMLEILLPVVKPVEPARIEVTTA